jgi:hypothetical protein
MAIKNAVSGSISEKLNKEKKIIFTNTIMEEPTLIPKKELTDLIKDWYDIDLIGDN